MTPIPSRGDVIDPLMSSDVKGPIALMGIVERNRGAMRSTQQEMPSTGDDEEMISVRDH